LASVLRGVGLRLAYADDVDRAWHEETLRYLTGSHLKGVQKQIAADPRVSARHSTEIFDPPLTAEQSSRPARPSDRPIRAKRERPLSLLAAAEPARHLPSPKRPRGLSTHQRSSSKARKREQPA
ncbi:hypothetical protein KEM55_005261, partial [Ascosphaera atra]